MCVVGVTVGFKVGVGLHHGSALSPLMFVVGMGRLTGQTEVSIDFDVSRRYCDL